MGCCQSCFGSDNDSSQGGDYNERSQLLGNPVSNNVPSHPSYVDDSGAGYGTSYPKRKADEQSALERILRETATNIIDVSALETHSVEQHEYLDRTKQYSHRLSNQTNLKSFPKVRPAPRVLSTLEDIPAIEKILSIEPISQDDLAMMNLFTERIANAITGIKVEHKEDLVVQFGI